MLEIENLSNVMIRKVRYKKQIDFWPVFCSDYLKQRARMEQWLATNCVGEYRIYGSKVMFENKHDATLAVIALS